MDLYLHVDIERLAADRGGPAPPATAGEAGARNGAERPHEDEQQELDRRLAAARQAGD